MHAMGARNRCCVRCPFDTNDAIIFAAGLAYLGSVKPTLQLATQLLVSPVGDALFLQPTCGRLANAMVAVMGPEFAIGSPEYQVRGGKRVVS